MKLRNYLLVIGTIVSLLACNSKAGKNGNSSALPPSQGGPGNIIVVADSTTWYGPAGRALIKTFEIPVFGLPRAEIEFKLLKVDPYKLNRVLKGQRNMIFLTDLSSSSAGNQRLKSFFTKESLDQIDVNPDLFMYSKRDEFAKNQFILHLFGQNDELLADRIEKNTEPLLKYFRDSEEGKIYGSLYKGKSEKGIIKVLQSDYQCYLKVPYGYEIAMQEDDFIWLRIFGQKIDKNLFIYKMPYTNQNQFQQEKLVALRNDICKKYVFGDPKRPETFMKTETEYYNVDTQEINFKNEYAVKMSGLWITNTRTMGGPFKSYTTVNESSGDLYYVEGFLYAPGEDQRDMMKELNVILKTFKTLNQEG